jgi:hypothetical protein
MNSNSAIRTVTVEPNWEATSEWFARTLAEHAFDRFATGPLISFIDQAPPAFSASSDEVAHVGDLE